jgi:prepilin-type N-terminal cleavage/methylation domain-containing protein
MRIKPKAFTLVELLVVISIIALLLSILTPSLRKAKSHAERAVCMSNLKQMAIAQILYAEDNCKKFGDRGSASGQSTYAIQKYLAPSGATPNPTQIMRDGRYIWDGYLPDFVLAKRGVATLGKDFASKAMYCPSARSTHVRHGKYPEGTWPTSWRTDDWNYYMTSYSYFFMGSESDQPYYYYAWDSQVPMPKTTEDKSYTPLFADAMVQRYQSCWQVANHFAFGGKDEVTGEDPAGLNQAHVDGSVKWYSYPKQTEAVMFYRADPSFKIFWGAP